MNLRAIPDPVWYALAAAATIATVYVLARRVGSTSAGDAGRSVGAGLVNATGGLVAGAHDAVFGGVGRGINDVAVPGDGSLGTALYDFLHGAPTFDPGTTAGTDVESWAQAYDYGQGGPAGVPWRPTPAPPSTDPRDQGYMFPIFGGGG